MVAEKQSLIVGPAWVGDMVMAQTLFKLLKAAQPLRHLDVIAPTWSHPLLARMPEIRSALDLPLKHGELGLKKRYALARQLRERSYDEAIVLPNSFKSALIPYWAHIPKRTGWRGEYRFGLLNDQRQLNKTRLPLMIQRFAALAFPNNAALPSALPYPRLQINFAERKNSIEQLNLRTDEPILALCPGAEFGSSKRWPTAYYAEVAKYYRQLGWQVWIFGSSNDESVAEEIQHLSSDACVNLVGKTTLGMAIDLLSYVQIVVTNDSGLMHIAAAIDKPLVVFYGSTSMAFTPPLSDQVQILSSHLPCAPCFKRECPLQHHNCMKMLAPEQAIQAVKALLEPCAA